MPADISAQAQSRLEAYGPQNESGSIARAANHIPYTLLGGEPANTPADRPESDIS